MERWILFISSYNEHRGIVLCVCGIYCPRERDPSSVALHQVSSFSLKGFLTWVFLTQVEGLSTDGVTTVQIVKPSGANCACDFDNEYTSI